MIITLNELSQSPLSNYSIHFWFQKIVNKHTTWKGHFAIKEVLAIHKPQHELLHSSYFIEPLLTVLQNNYFNFNGKHYSQVSLQPWEPSLYSHMLIYSWASFERLHVYTYSLQPYLWKWFTDDILIILSDGLTALQKFIDSLDKFIPVLSSPITSSYIGYHF